MPENKQEIDFNSSKIELMQNEINRLQSRLDYFEREKLRFQTDQLVFDDNKRAFAGREKHALYYEALTSLIKNNPQLQSEWVRFMTLIKLVCEPEELKALEG